MRRRSLLKALCALPFVPKVLAEPRRKLSGWGKPQVVHGDEQVLNAQHYLEMVEEKLRSSDEEWNRQVDAWIWDEPRR